MIPLAIFTEVIDALNGIFCTLANIALAFAWCLAEVVNAVIWALGLVIAGLLLVLPDVPSEAPEFDSAIVNGISWVLPIGAIISSITVWLTLYLIFMAYRIIARWVKAL